MELKEFQERTLDRLSSYLHELKQQKKVAVQTRKANLEAGGGNLNPDYCSATWEVLKNKNLLPKMGHDFAPYISRQDGLDRHIPNVCLQVPTGGGKTLLGAHALGRINREYCGRTTGLVVWVVPSNAIYAQTLKAFRRPGHPYRQVLRHAAAGRLKVIKHTENFSRQDVDQGLLVMLLMLQSANRETKNTLRLFNNRGGFTDFFPATDATLLNQDLHKKIRNLDVLDADQGHSFARKMVKHSLGNLMRIQRPIFVIDESHKTVSDLARKTIEGFNPCFILELSATPNAGTRIESNVVVNISGLEVKAEEMIKLPINLYDQPANWQATLREAWEKTKALHEKARQHRANGGNYIRPIMLVQVERTGKEQTGKGFIHADEVKKYCITKLGIAADSVRIKVSGKDEIEKEDLLSEESQVRVIITKQALQEGWDCSFAYVLALLAKNAAQRSLTQLIGRVLRQPYARLTDDESLNQSYVFSYYENVVALVEKIHLGLKREGLEDLRHELLLRSDAKSMLSLENVGRREKFSKLEIVLPQVLHKDASTKEGWRPIDFRRDILAEVPWEEIDYSRKNDVRLSDLESMSKVHVQIDLSSGETEGGQLSGSSQTHAIEADEEIDLAFFVRELTEIIPNPWQAASVMQDTINVLLTRQQNPFTKKQLNANRSALLDDMCRDLREQVYGHYEYDGASHSGRTEELFQRKVDEGSIVVKNIPNMSWRSSKVIKIASGARRLARQNNAPMQKSLFDHYDERSFNETLERPVAYYLDEHALIHYWHRMIERQEYGLQGWRKEIVYPDFLIAYCIDEEGHKELGVIETKGSHLIGSDDTNYKRRLFEYFERLVNSDDDLGKTDVQLENGELKAFRIVSGDKWREQLAELLHS